MAHLSHMFALAGFLSLGAVTLPVFGQATTNPQTGANQASTNETGANQAAAVEKIKPDLGAWWNDAVFYEVFVRSFADSNDGPLAKDGIGDFRGLIDRLDYLNDGDPTPHASTASLGVTALWLMPIMQSPSYHGYDISDYKKVNAQYGSNQDYQLLLKECEKRGIRVILDLVPNHCSRENPWFKDASDPKSPTHDWFIWSKDCLLYTSPSPRD